MYLMNRFTYQNVKLQEKDETFLFRDDLIKEENVDNKILYNDKMLM